MRDSNPLLEDLNLLCKIWIERQKRIQIHNSKIWIIQHDLQPSASFCKWDSNPSCKDSNPLCVLYISRFLDSNHYVEDSNQNPFSFTCFLKFFKRNRILLVRIRIHGLWLLYFFIWDSNLSYRDSNLCCPSKFTGIQIRIRCMRIRIHLFKQTFLTLFGIKIRIHSLGIQILVFSQIYWNWDSNPLHKDSNLHLQILQSALSKIEIWILIWGIRFHLCILTCFDFVWSMLKQIWIPLPEIRIRTLENIF